MPFTVRSTKSVVEGATSLSASVDHSCDVVAKMSESVVDATTDAEYLISLDVSKLQVFSMLSTQDMTVKTNSSGSPQETFTLTAGAPVVWQVGDAAIFAGDVTALYLTNASGATATFTLISGSTN